jgi:hypothetical protein
MRDSVYELRMYTLKPGRRDALIELFEREFVESQEAVGAHIVGTFRDLDRDDRFVWIRSFADMPARGAALQAFYDGPVWAAHREAANATMVDSDNVLLLRPARIPSPHFNERPTAGAATIPASIFVVIVFPLRTREQEAECARYFDSELAPAWRNDPAEIVATFLTEHSENNFPRLPVREKESVFVTVMRFPSADGCEAERAVLEASRAWLEGVETRLAAVLAGPAEILRLRPTARSALR